MASRQAIVDKRCLGKYIELKRLPLKKPCHILKNNFRHFITRGGNLKSFRCFEKSIQEFENNARGFEKAD